jgi:tetratricopeptide (TPR) repeat protein
MKVLCLAGLLVMIVPIAQAAADLDSALDRQDRVELQKFATEFAAAADRSPKDADAQYRAALAASYLSEVAIELRDKVQSQQSAETGIRFAERAVALQPNVSEYHRLLGTLYGQTIVGGNVLSGLSRGKRSKDEIDKAVELDPKSSRNWVARAVGNYYLPAALGGGPDKAIEDAHKAVELDPKSSEAYLWLGLSLRKLHRNAEARQAFQKALDLNPRRVWVKEQLDKTPAS